MLESRQEDQMNILGLSDLTWLSGIAFVLCLAFGLYMVIKKKPGIVPGFILF